MIRSVHCEFCGKRVAYVEARRPKIHPMRCVECADQAVSMISNAPSDPVPGPVRTLLQKGPTVQLGDILTMREELLKSPRRRFK